MKDFILKSSLTFFNVLILGLILLPILQDKQEQDTFILLDRIEVLNDNYYYNYNYIIEDYDYYFLQFDSYDFNETSSVLFITLYATGINTTPNVYYNYNNEELEIEENGVLTIWGVNT